MEETWITRMKKWLDDFLFYDDEDEEDEDCGDYDDGDTEDDEE